ncbi:MAG: methyltransferase, TIGR04325 family [Leptospiraceae bacterium]|nr:methyltransferase, TIGR04325 family [Leptospiraceae bacterium]
MIKEIKKWLPPIVSGYIENVITNRSKKFSSYEEAIKTCTSKPYEERELIEVIAKKTAIYRDKIKKGPIEIDPTLSYSINSIIRAVHDKKENETTRVIDFGGACGAHYYSVKAMLRNKCKLCWTVVETPTMVEYGREFRNKELRFSTDLCEATNERQKVDILHTSGTLQCVENPREYLKKIINIGATWLMFNRLGVNRKNRDVITIHKSRLSWNGIGELPKGYNDRWIRYPFIFISEEYFMEIIRRNYEIVAIYEDKTGVYNVPGENIYGCGLLCKRKTS